MTPDRKDLSGIEDVCCVIGMSSNNKPIWKKVGIKSITKTTGRDVILLDKTFNPAGVMSDQDGQTSVALYFFKRDDKYKDPKGSNAKPTNWADFDDDIPF